MQIALFIFYLVAFSFLIKRIPFFKNAGIANPALLALFFVKILAGMAYGKFYTLPKYYSNADTWRFYRLSIEETKWLIKSPLAFLNDLFSHGYGTTGNIFSGENSYWNDLKSNVPVKLMAIFNVLSNNSYYTNIIFFNFLFFFGLVAIFKILYSIYPQKKWIIITAVFLLPSTLFWCSGIHKDGLILSAIGVSLYCFSKILTDNYSLKYWVIILLSFTLLFSLRNYILFALVPALVCWRLTEMYPDRKTIIILTFYSIGVICFFIIPLIIPSVNPPFFLAAKQHEFLLLAGDSQVQTKALQPTFPGFIAFLPHALDMAFLRPHPYEFKNLSYVPAIIENVLLIILMSYSIIYFHKKTHIPPLVICFFMFSISVLLITGYTIPFVGATVRYRSLVLPLLITPLLCMADFSLFKKSH